MRANDELPFYLIDVFTQQRFGGNPLAVVPDADAVDEETMRQIARELNQSETTFLLQPPDASKADWQLRSFTAAGIEVFGAGHNALGAWWWLAASGALRLNDERTSFRQLIGDRTLPVDIVSRGGRPLSIGMTQTRPIFGATVEDRASLARALGAREEDLAWSTRPQVVSTGAAHLMVPVRNRDALAHCKPDAERLAEVLRSVGGQGCTVFTLDALAPDPTAYVRFFNPTVGIREDPATGSAAGPLACYLRAQGVLKTDALIVHQGIEMHRPSRIEVFLDNDQVRVSGSAVVVAQGRLQLGPGSNDGAEVRPRSPDAQELTILSSRSPIPSPPCSRDLTLRLHRPGALAEMGEALGRAGVSIEGGAAFDIGGELRAHFLVSDENAAAAREALHVAGIDVMADREVLVQRLAQEIPGQLGMICRRMADAGVNIVVLYSDHQNQLVLSWWSTIWRAGGRSLKPGPLRARPAARRAHRRATDHRCSSIAILAARSFARNLRGKPE